MKKVLVENIQDCTNMINELKEQRSKLPYHGQEETDHKVCLKVLALDAAITAIETEKRQKERLLNDNSDENLIGELFR